MNKSRVFISHKSSEKARVKPIALALLDAGFTLFIDNPAAMGLDAPFCRSHDIRWIEGDFNLFIHKVLKECCAVLGCLSHRIEQDANVWNYELQIAFQESKLVLCRIDNVDTQQLPKLGIVRVGDLQSWQIETMPHSMTEAGSARAVQAIQSQDSFSYILDALRQTCSENDRERMTCCSYARELHIVLNTARTTHAHLLKQRAMHGAAIPPLLQFDLDAAEKTIGEIERQIANHTCTGQSE